MSITKYYLVFFIIVSFTASTGLGQEQSEEDLAKEAQNPIANLISLPLQNNTNFGIGPDNETNNILNIQPVIPFSITEDWNLITRTIVPIISQPRTLTKATDDRIYGLGDIVFTAFFSPKESGKLTWGVGPVIQFPTATDDSLGTNKWSAGVSAVLLTMPGKWVIGSLLSNIWSIGGSGDIQVNVIPPDTWTPRNESDVNLFTWQYFINYNLSKGWYLTSAPIITANWEADSGNRWTIPFGGGFGKLFKIGKQPINGQVQTFYNVAKPVNGADWQLRLQLQFLFPK